ncbi:MAG: hypothetical protein V1754_07610 [Pseudomonadota bacterium]
MYLSKMYAPYQLNLFGRQFIILRKMSADSSSPGRIAKDAAYLRKHFEQDVAFVLDELSSWERKRLIEKGTPFIVPGRQLFLPMLFMDLREHFPQRTIEKTDYLSRAAQHTVLRQILHGDVENRDMVDAATLLGYSAMMMTKIRSELVAHDLCTAKINGRARQIVFSMQSKQLWQKAKPHMRSPVFRRHFLVGKVCGAQLAGPSALALQSTLHPDDLSTVAVWKKQYRTLMQKCHVTEIENEEGADLILEEWYYDPRKISGTDAVDPLSLYLSLTDNPDERIQIALEELLEKITWLKD